MPNPIIVAFMGGAIAMASLAAGIFFLRFWARTRDRLFLAFAVAFWLMALNQALPVLLGLPDESLAGVYLLRFAAFALIILAIVSKNVRPKGG